MGQDREGYEYDDFATISQFSEEGIAGASPEMTRTIEIEQFIDLADIDALLLTVLTFCTAPKARKRHVLPQEATFGAVGKAGIARVVIPRPSNTAALIARRRKAMGWY